ncbi:MAG TPA: MOSC domain-containing protein [Jatrophihabitans sp.]|nr:MOSC domain-containing protein [Jatrophihabitans sp.]
MAGAGGSVQAIRRYPVKCMAGESLDQVELDSRGMVGDRWFAVRDQAGHFASGKRTRRFRRHDEVFGYRAMTTGAGAVQVSHAGGSWPVGDRGLDAHLSRTLGEPARVVPEGPVPHFDAGAVSLVSTATLQWCEQELGVDADPRRLRANLLIAADEAFVEERWLGRVIGVGDALLEVVARTERCRTIDVAQDGAGAARRWLKPLAEARGLQLGVYARVAVPGVIRVGDELRIG